MIRRTVLIACFGLIASTFAWGQALAPSPDVVPPSVLANVEQTGEAIFVLDRAASVATDALEETRGFKRDRRLGGWITEQDASGVRVSFVGAKGNAPVAVLYRAVVTPAGIVEQTPEAFREPQPLEGDALLQYRARSLAMRSVEQSCSKKVNTVVLPRSSPDANWIVYVLASTTKSGVFPVGGNFRFEVDPGAGRVVSERAFSRSCIELTAQPNLEAFTLSHLLDPNPTEIHVFVNRLSGVPVYLLTMENKALWIVEQGRIRFVKTIEEKQ